MNWDKTISFWIQKHFPTIQIRKYLGWVNRGEVFLLILLPFLWLSEDFQPFFPAFFFIGLFAFLTDRLVLVLKKAVARKRPLVSVAGKTDTNPDMKQSFPSAHSANSMVVVVILVFAFGFSFWFFLFTFFAGVGRLLSLHHYPSDVIGGWVLGFLVGLSGVWIWEILLPFLLTW